MGQLTKNALENLMHEINALSSANVRVQGFPLVVGNETKREWHGILIHPIDSHSSSVINATFVVSNGQPQTFRCALRLDPGKPNGEGLLHGSSVRLAEKGSASVLGIALRTRLDVCI